MDFAALRRKTGERLAEFGLEIPGPLPLLGDEDVEWCRPVEQVVARCHALAAIIGMEEGGDPDDIADEMRELGLVELLNGRERLFFDDATGVGNAPASALEQAKIDISWRQEALWALLWALGFVDDLPPDQLCGDSSAYARMAPDLDPTQTVDGIELRPLDELVATIDLYYCLHWHDREDALPPGIEHGVVVERRHALEWLFQDEPWDEVDTST